MCLSILVSSVCITSSGIAGSYGGSVSNFSRNRHTVHHSVLSNVFNHQFSSVQPLSHVQLFATYEPQQTVAVHHQLLKSTQTHVH